jgi:hypothetical protein
MLVTVGRYFDPWEAQILRARLESEGIPASVAGDHHVVANWPWAIALGGVALQVPDEFLDAAQEIVQAYHDGSLERDLVAEDPQAVERCPVCSSEKIRATVPAGQRALAIATFLMAQAPFPTSASRMQCETCGHRWSY